MLMKCGSFETFLYVEQQLGRFWRFGHAWLRQPSEFYDEINFLGINCCSTYKKVSKNPHFISIYFREYEIHYYRAVSPILISFLVISEKTYGNSKAK